MTTAHVATRLDRRYGLLLDEIHAEMGRHRMSQVTLAARLGQSQPWVNRRMMGHTILTWPEVDAIAAALDVTQTELARRVDERLSMLPGDHATGWLRRRGAKRRQRPEVALHISPDTHPRAFPAPRESPERVNLLRLAG